MIDIIMTCYNPWEKTKIAIDTLFEHTRNFRLTIIDHQSTDETWDNLIKLQDKYPDRVIIMQRPPESPLCWAWNTGIDMARSEIVIITANDIVFSPDWLEPILNAFKMGDYISLQPYNTLSIIPDNFPNNYKKEAKIDKVPKDNMIGCCFAIHKGRLEEMKKLELYEPYPGRFDENFYPYWYDDYDFVYRLQKIGKPLRTVFNSYVHHYTGAGITITPSEENIKIKERLEAYFNKKHNGKANLKETKC